MTPFPPRDVPKRKLHLALQGGGAHGAFTWGALERLLDDPRFEIGRISGTSAGALNGAALAAGMAKGGRQGAKDNLALLWRQVCQAGLLSALLNVPFKKPGLGIWDDAVPVLSPYQTSPMALETLRYILRSVIDEDVLRNVSSPPLFVNAVHVQTGVSRVFGPGEMTIAALMASASAPMMFQAVQIDGESYWDGSYAGNPMLWPLYEGCLDADILLIELTPRHRAETPTTAKNILNRINEIASIQALVSELRALDAANRTPGVNIRMHVLSLPDALAKADMEPSIKRTVDAVLFQSLRQKGRAACDDWLRLHATDIGRRSSVDIGASYLQPFTKCRAQSERLGPGPTMA